MRAKPLTLVFRRRLKQLRILDIFRVRESITAIILLGYLVVLSFSNPIFFRPMNLRGIAFAVSVEIPVIIGMQTLLALGVFDLSVGSVAALSGMITGVLLKSTGHVFLSVAGGLTVGMIFGLINGFLVTKAKVNALVVTLATMGMARAIALGIVRGRVITKFPSSFSVIGQGVVYGVPVPILFSVIIMIVAGFSFRKIRYWRRFYYVGSSEQAATYSGINVSRTVLMGFVVAAVTAAFVGIIMSSRAMSSSPLVFSGLALEAIAACVIGGSSIKGGEGSVIGAVMGLFIIIITRKIMHIFHISVYWKEFVVGIILIVAVVLDSYMRSRETLSS